jgi:hypothetical protein
MKRVSFRVIIMALGIMTLTAPVTHAAPVVDCLVNP